LRIPEIVLGCLLTVAVFALGMVFVSSQTRPVSNISRQTETTAQPHLPSKSDIEHNAGGKGYEKPERESEFWSAKFTDWLLAVFTGFLGLFTYRLWQSTDRLWLASRDDLETTNRAFVSIDGFEVELTTAADTKAVDVSGLPERYRSDPDLFITRFAVFPKWKNAGNTPTKNMVVRIGWRGPVGPTPPDYVYRAEPEPFFLAPRALELGGMVEMNGAAQLIDWSWMPIGLEPTFFIWGRADYEDIFGKKHFVEWCRLLRFERHDGKKLRASFLQWGEYNRSD
jgi:hypothetical protein